jgi:hypothetical protein
LETAHPEQAEACEDGSEELAMVGAPQENSDTGRDAHTWQIEILRAIGSNDRGECEPYPDQAELQRHVSSREAGKKYQAGANAHATGGDKCGLLTKQWLQEFEVQGQDEGNGESAQVQENPWEGGAVVYR